jgi:hypothetical protein
MANRISPMVRCISIIVIAFACALFNSAGANDTGCLEVGEVGDVNEDIACCNGTEPLQNYLIDQSGNCVKIGESIPGNRICLDCGNGICEEFENECTCPDDCDPNGCIGQGETYYPNEGDKCCAYLEHAWNYVVDENGKCSWILKEGSWKQQLICVNCGNGICEEGENPCICPSDCGDTVCAGHGEIPWPTAEGYLTYSRCCEGSIVRYQKECFDEDCVNLYEVHGGGGYAGICLSCGDGVCDETVESKCNCPEDCGYIDIESDSDDDNFSCVVSTICPRP